MAAVGFLSRYMNGPLPYNHKYNVLSVSLNKKFLSLSQSYAKIFSFNTMAAILNSRNNSTNLNKDIRIVTKKYFK